MSFRFSYEFQGMRVDKDDPEYVTNKPTFDYLERRVAEIDRNHTGMGACFSDGDCLSDETQTCAVKIFWKKF